MLAEAPKDLTPKRVMRQAGEWRPQFIGALRNTANIRAACQAAGISRTLAYDHRERSTEFAKQWDVAMQEACDVLEAAARQRALGSSDTLLIFLLKSHRPEVYRETQRHEHSGPNGAPMRFTFTFTRAEAGDDET